MCGLVGIWRHDGGEADLQAIDAMLATIAHRGPDGIGAWQEGRVALGHRRLSIIDLSEAAAQPMLTEDGRGVLVYNGEVYNYRELRRDLEQEGVKFRSAGDTEVVLQALHHWGPATERIAVQRDVCLRLSLDEIDFDRLVAAANGDPTRYVAGFRTLLKKSVRLHLASDAPLAAMCSGGVDSSLIAAYAKEELPDVPAYVADIPWTGGEGDQAERVGRHLGISLRRIEVDQACFLQTMGLCGLALRCSVDPSKRCRAARGSASLPCGWNKSAVDGRRVGRTVRRL
jgi:asparagine synthetase B (glutamine-hydrolysing)